MVKKYYSWEEVYEDLQSFPYNEVLDIDIQSNNYYEIPVMIDYFREKNEIEKVNFLITLENEIENETGRVYSIGDKFILDDDVVYCHIEITDFNEMTEPYIEFSNIRYKTNKKEITQNFNLNNLKRLR